MAVRSAAIDCVRYQQEDDGAVQQPPWIMTSQIRRQAMAAHRTDPGAHDLNGDHERIGQQDGPQHVEAELRTRLRIGGDTARVVVSCPGDESGSELRKPRIGLTIDLDVDFFRRSHVVFDPRPSGKTAIVCSEGTDRI